MKRATPLRMWAPIYQGTRGEWIRYDCVRGTRREARRAYLETWAQEHQKKALKAVRFARVIVMLAEHEQGEKR